MQAVAHREYLADQQSTKNNEYNQSNLLIESLPLSAHKNNYLTKLIILLNKTGRLPRPANFPTVMFWSKKKRYGVTHFLVAR